MKLYAFSDFHLSGNPPTKPMDIFGSHWKYHREKIRDSWINTVTADDAVIMAGDLSWAMNLDTALSDLAYLADLPGRKIIVRGNHDFWWSTVTKMTRLTHGAFEFIHNSAIQVGDVALAGTRWWRSETSGRLVPKDLPIIAREEGRLVRSLEAAKALSCHHIVSVLHYPPFDEGRRPSRILRLMKDFGVTDCVYGHLHGTANFVNLPREIDGIRLHLTSADYLDFRPLLIGEVSCPN